MIKVVVFDLYGTLITSHEGPESKDEALSRITREAGHEVYYQEMAVARQFVSFIDYPRGRANTPNDYYARVLERLEITTDRELTGKLARKDLELEKTVLYPDVVPVVSVLRTRGIKTAIVTTIASWKFVPLLEQSNVGVDFVCTAREANAVKPNPRIYIAVLNKFDAKPEDAISIGDDPRTDITPAKRLGMKTVLLCRKEKVECSDADHTVSSLIELLDIL